MKATEKSNQTYQVIRCIDQQHQKGSLELIQEEPLLIRIQDQAYSVVMRTPGQELSHAAGFCLGEGLVDSPDDFSSIGYCQELDPNVIDVRLEPERQAKVEELLNRRGFVSQTSCGICGKEMLQDLCQAVTPIENDLQINIKNIMHSLGQLFATQQFYPRTRGAHAAMLCDLQAQMLSFAEDVGRHNALDKAVGKAFMHKQLIKAGILVLSSRISYELVQKAARAKLPVMISKSRPTALAVEMGQALNITIAFTDKGKESELIIACGANRIKRQ